MPYILGIDQGTTKTKCVLVNEKGEIASLVQTDFPQHCPQQGYVEHKAQEIKKSVRDAVMKCLEKANIKKHEVVAIGITNQRETTCLFDEKGISPLPFIVWQCRRSKAQTEKILKHREKINNVTGLNLDPYFSATKLMWIFETYPELLNKAKSRKILFGTIDSFLMHWFSGFSLHISDVTNVSRTMLMDLTTFDYNEDLLELFNIPKACLPKIVKNVGPYGYTKGLDFLPDGIPLASSIGDQQSALLAQKCLNEGEAKLTLGTGAFVLQNIGQRIKHVKSGLLTSVAYWLFGDPYYCLEGSAFAAGASIEFISEILGVDYRKIDEFASLIQDAAGVYFIPALCGLGAPHWKSDARGAFFGLSRATKKEHLALSVIEGIVLQNVEIFLNMKKNEEELKTLKIDGGLARSDIVMQKHADLLNMPCMRKDIQDSTVLGAAFLAGITIGKFDLKETPDFLTSKETMFYPKIDDEERKNKIGEYMAFVRRLIN